MLIVLALQQLRRVAVDRRIVFFFAIVSAWFTLSKVGANPEHAGEGRSIDQALVSYLLQIPTSSDCFYYTGSMWVRANAENS